LEVMLSMRSCFQRRRNQVPDTTIPVPLALTNISVPKYCCKWAETAMMRSLLSMSVTRVPESETAVETNSPNRNVNKHFTEYTLINLLISYLRISEPKI
jgi:hypothetical protein